MSCIRPMNLINLTPKRGYWETGKALSEGATSSGSSVTIREGAKQAKYPAIDPCKLRRCPAPKHRGLCNTEHFG